jgi:CheY-like chemotaxis protein
VGQALHLPAGVIPVWQVGKLDAPPALGQVSAASGRLAADAVRAAALAALFGQVQAVVTAPLNTTALAAAGESFPGHTEMLQALAANQLAQVSQVYCLGSRLLLSAVVRAAPRPEGILAAVTTEEEGLAKVVRHQPDLLVVSEGLERGCGVELTLRVKRDHPRTRVLLLVSRNASRSRAREAIAAGCDGVLRDGVHVGGVQPLRHRALRNGSFPCLAASSRHHHCCWSSEPEDGPRIASGL